jgi:hypothetical protein
VHAVLLDEGEVVPRGVVGVRVVDRVVVGLGDVEEGGVRDALEGLDAPRRDAELLVAVGPGVLEADALGDGGRDRDVGEQAGYGRALGGVALPRA